MGFRFCGKVWDFPAEVERQAERDRQEDASAAASFRAIQAAKAAHAKRQREEDVAVAKLLAQDAQRERAARTAAPVPQPNYQEV